MIHFIFESNKELNNRTFPLPKGIRKHLKNTLDNYHGDKTIDGYKRLNNVLSMDSISYHEMKRIKNYFDNYKGTYKSDEFILNGGEPMMTWVNNTLNSATNAIKDFKQAKKDAGVNNSFIRPHEKDRQNKKKNKPTQVKIKTNNKNLSNNNVLKFESILHEENYHEFYDYLGEYGVSYVLYSFNDDRNGKQNWGPLINPAMYKKALDEYTTYGKLMRFPSSYIYQWIGIIMRNTAQLIANTELAGHSQWFPIDDFEDFLPSYFGTEDYGYVDGDTIHFKDENGEECEEYVLDFCDRIGLYGWMVAPDGSEAWSDYGLEPLHKLISEYNETKSPEEVLVLINKILDITHQRGDMSSIFIQGGKNSLNNITYRKNENKQPRTIYITEETFNKLLSY